MLLNCFLQPIPQGNWTIESNLGQKLVLFLPFFGRYEDNLILNFSNLYDINKKQ